MTDPTDRHMVFTVYDGHVKFEANYGQQLNGSEPLNHEVSAQDMIDHLVSVFKPTTSETLYDSDT